MSTSRALEVPEPLGRATAVAARKLVMARNFIVIEKRKIWGINGYQSVRTNRGIVGREMRSVDEMK